jgi:hypothetical protein
LAMVLNLVMLMKMVMVTTVLYGLSKNVFHETRMFITDTTNYFTNLYLTHRLNFHINIILLHCRVLLLMDSLSCFWKNRTDGGISFAVLVTLSTEFRIFPV